MGGQRETRASRRDRLSGCRTEWSAASLQGAFCMLFVAAADDHHRCLHQLPYQLLELHDCILRANITRHYNTTLQTAPTSRHNIRTSEPFCLHSAVSGASIPLLLHHLLQPTPSRPQNSRDVRPIERVQRCNSRSFAFTRHCHKSTVDTSHKYHSLPAPI